MESDTLRQRAKRKKIRATFPDGKMICYANVTETFIAILAAIGSERFDEIDLELCHLPLLTREVYPRYKDWIKPVCDGWYVNTQSNTDQKYLQLRLINDTLCAGLTIEMGEDFEKLENPNKMRGTKSKENMYVRFPDGETFSDFNPLVKFQNCLRKIGIDMIMRKGFKYGANPLITNYRHNNRQVEIDPGRWVTLPATTREKVKLLRVISASLQLGLEISSDTIKSRFDNKC